MNNLWLVPFVGYLITTTASALLRRKFVVGTKLDPHVSSIVTSTIVGFPFLLAFASQTGGVDFVRGKALLASIIYAFLYVAYNKTSFYALKYTDTSTFATVVKLHVPLVVLMGDALFGEFLSQRQFFGMATMLASSTMIGRLHLSKNNLIYLSLSVLLLALMVIIERYVVIASSPGPAILTTFSMSYLLLVSLAWGKLRASARQIIKELKTMVKLSLVSAPMPALLLLATSMVGNVSLTSSLATIKVVLVAFGAVIFLGERDNLKIKIFAAILSLCGALLI